jgi:hypothetical protein
MSSLSFVIVGGVSLSIAPGYNAATYWTFRGKIQPRAHCH